MFSEDQKAALNAPLSGNHIKHRAHAGRQLSYLEGWHCIAEANRIFGHGSWHRETVEMRLVREPVEIDGKYRVGYAAKVKVTVTATTGMDITREGWGYGSGIDRDVGSAHESAIKEAETDAMKRALMTFGNPFGLALYDKEQREVDKTNGQAAERDSLDVWVRDTMVQIDECATITDLERLWKASKVELEHVKTKKAHLYDALVKHAAAHKLMITARTGVG